MSHSFASHLHHLAISRHLYQNALGPQCFKNIVSSWVSSIFAPQLAGNFKGYRCKASRRKIISILRFCLYDIIKLSSILLFVFMTLSDCNIFICIYLVFYFDQKIRKRRECFHSNIC